MKDRAAARKPPHYFNTGLFRIVKIHLGVGVLIFSHYYRTVVAPKHKNIVPRVFQKVLLGGKIEIGVHHGIVDNEHKRHFLQKNRVPRRFRKSAYVL